MTVLQQEYELSTECEICGENIEVTNDVEMHEIIECTICGTEFEVISTDPFILQEAPMVAEDWGE